MRPADLRPLDVQQKTNLARYTYGQEYALDTSGNSPMSASDIMRRKDVFDRSPWDGGGAGADPRQHARWQHPPHRIKGQFCPFCGGRIPREFIICPNCGKDV